MNDPTVTKRSQGAMWLAVALALVGVALSVANIIAIGADGPGAVFPFSNTVAGLFLLASLLVQWRTRRGLFRANHDDAQ